MVSRVVATFPGMPRLLQWRCSGCGSPSSSMMPARARDDRRRRHPAVALDRLGQVPGVLAPLPGRHAPGIDGLHAVGLRGPDEPRHHVAGALGLPRLQEIHDDLVVRHQEEARLVEDGRVAELLVGVLGAQDRHGRLGDRGVAHPGVEVARRERRGGQPAEAHPPLRAYGGTAGPWRWSSGVIARAKLSAAPATWVWTSTPPGRTTMPVASIVRPPSTRETIRPSEMRDVPDLAVDLVGGVVDLPAGDAQHRPYAVSGVPFEAGVQGGLAAAAWRMRRRTSSSVGYGERRAGRSGSGTSSMR